MDIGVPNLGVDVNTLIQKKWWITHVPVARDNVYEKKILKLERVLEQARIDWNQPMQDSWAKQRKQIRPADSRYHKAVAEVCMREDLKIQEKLIVDANLFEEVLCSIPVLFHEYVRMEGKFVEDWFNEQRAFLRAAAEGTRERRRRPLPIARVEQGRIVKVGSKQVFQPTGVARGTRDKHPRLLSPRGPGYEFAEIEIPSPKHDEIRKEARRYILETFFDGTKTKAYATYEGEKYEETLGDFGWRNLNQEHRDLLTRDTRDAAIADASRQRETARIYWNAQVATYEELIEEVREFTRYFRDEGINKVRQKEKNTRAQTRREDLDKFSFLDANEKRSPLRQAWTADDI